MNSKERVIASLNHQNTDKIAVDFGSTAVTGIHVLAVERLRKHYGLRQGPIKVIEPYQMLGELDSELIATMGLDVLGLLSRNNMFGFENNNWKAFKTHWGQDILVPGNFNTKKEEDGNTFIFPEGDTSARASGKMPSSSYFFDTIIRQEQVATGKSPLGDLGEKQRMRHYSVLHT